jgi:phage terminase large subunit-like protein
MASTKSRRAELLDGPAPPRLRVAPASRDNSWEDVADLAASLGMPLDEWQEQALEAAMGERSDGRWASKFVGISAPRQNGKSQLIVARALAGVLLFGEKTIIISAHETDTAREIWRRMIDVIEDNPTLEARVTARMNAINRESLTFGVGMDKQIIKLKARSQTGSRGFSADCLLLDEAQILGKRAWGALVPTMSAMPNPQLWLFGTPPTEDDDPFAFSRVRESAKAGKARHCWLEWSADPRDDYDSPETWAKANPSYGVRLSYEACADDRSAMDDDQFAMERLGMWPDGREVSWAGGVTSINGSLRGSRVGA